MICKYYRCIAFACACLFNCLAFAHPMEIKLPAETVELKSSTLPGHAIAAQKCTICHSADYINLQPGNMNLVQWIAEVTKMQHAYGAPLEADEIRQIGEYLATTYGYAKSPLAPVLGKNDATANKASNVALGAAPDAKVLLNANGCLGCHSIDKKVVGPSYKDVAAHYRSDTSALSKVQASIRQGGTGKWGSVPMPPFGNLHPEDLKALAEFILSQ